MENILEKETIKKLIDEAFKAREFAYTPYSNFKVGAALLGKSGKVYRGCNIENAAFSPTNCAERTALFKAVSEGERDFIAIAVVGGVDGKNYFIAPPCGVCRQALVEFTEPEKFLVILANSVDEYEIIKLSELLPKYFSKKEID